MTRPVIARDELGTLTKIAQGGQGVVYQAPNVKVAFADSMVYKEYKPQTRANIDTTSLAAMPALVEDTLTDAQAELLVSIAAWPCALVGDGGRTTGFVMPAIPAQFFTTLTTAKGSASSAAEFRHLLNHPSVLIAHGITIGDAQRYALLRETASALAFLHTHGVCVGDLSPKNLLFSLTPHPAVYFIDCDAMRINTTSVLPQVETSGWQAPPGEELATIYSDTYKLGLLALRLLAGDQDTTNPAHLPATTPDLLRQIIIDTIKKRPTSRPRPEAWKYVLSHAIEHAQHQQKLSAAQAPVSDAGVRPELPVVHSRPAIGAAAPPVAQTPSADRTSPSPSPRTVSPAQRALLWTAAVLGVLAIITTSLIVLNANDKPTQQQQTLPTIGQSAASPPPAPPPAPTAPGQVTYSVTGTKAPFDQITISFTDAAGMRRILNNVYIPWTITLAPTSQSGVGSIEASSLLRLSKLNCSITASDGKVLSSNQNNQPQANC